MPKRNGRVKRKNAILKIKILRKKKGHLYTTYGSTGVQRFENYEGEEVFLSNQENLGAKKRLERKAQNLESIGTVTTAHNFIGKRFAGSISEVLQGYTLNQLKEIEAVFLKKKWFDSENGKYISEVEVYKKAS